MAKAFKNGARGITGSLAGPERKLLRELFGDVITVLEERAQIHELPEDLDPLYALTGMRPESANLPEPSDAAVKRLLPDASDDKDVADEFRRLTEADLITEKISLLRRAQLLLETEKLVLSVSEAQGFARALNDVRLVLAERLNIQSEADSERISQLVDAAKVTTSEEYLGLVYNLVSWVQDTLMQALMSAER
ncbi:DUF2017 domain-containing protein [Arthrobacter sp. MYb213]|uniref:DUF2017 domain-containing protein n=1 Tax=Arthrobacter sp. MYb213 TaxID=1848595 RepID=UPI000CFC34ED|nr:DUF2017 domain-containing protein [Arthrobacter sp. MYb213]PRB72848.1 hypothetical protein CQ011_04295 [Arthrobacter sp. MYb213]